MKVWCVLILIISCCSSCKETDRNRIARLVKHWEGKEILFPEDMVFTRYGIDTLNYKMKDSDFKLVAYIDSVGCISCKLNLQKWMGFVHEIDSLSSGTIEYLFIFHPNDKSELKYLLKRDKFDIPVFMDNYDKFNKLNKLPDDDLFHVFLLDKHNRISVIGNPIYNIKLKELYWKHIL